MNESNLPNVPEQTQGVSPTGPPLTALVVEDDPVARHMIVHALRREGIHCQWATNGEKAWSMLNSQSYDLAVIDILIPVKNGHTLAVDLLTRPQRPVIVIHTSVDEARLTRDLMARGVDDIIYKPTNYAAFAAKVRILCQRRRLACQEATQATAADAHPPTADKSRNEQPQPADLVEVVVSN